MPAGFPTPGMLHRLRGLPPTVSNEMKPLALICLSALLTAGSVVGQQTSLSLPWLSTSEALQKPAFDAEQKMIGEVGARVSLHAQGRGRPVCRLIARNTAAHTQHRTVWAVSGARAPA